MPRRGEIPGQEAMIVTPRGVGQPIVRNFEHSQFEAFDLAERNAHLINALDALSSIREAAGLQAGVNSARHRPRIEQRYKGNTDKVAEGTKNTAAEALQGAKTEFMLAYGRVAVDGIGRVEDQREAEKLRSEFSNFFNKYGAPGTRPERKAYRNKLLRGLSWMAQLHETPVTQEPVGEVTAEASEDEDPLGIYERVIVVKNDDRSGFFVATHQEKNMALVFLDYIDNPKYPNGIGNQLEEVHQHQRKWARKAYGDLHAQKRQHLEGGDISKLAASMPDEFFDLSDTHPNKVLKAEFVKYHGRRVIMSKIYEMIDYYNQAESQAVAMEMLCGLLSETPKPTLNLSEVAEDHGTAVDLFNPLLRYIDQQEFLRRGKPVDSGTGDPMRTQTTRLQSSHDVLTMEPRKVVGDIYTSAADQAEVLPYLENRRLELIVADIRPLAGEVFQDQLRRRDFWQVRLNEATLYFGGWPEVRMIRRGLLQ